MAIERNGAKEKESSYIYIFYVFTAKKKYTYPIKGVVHLLWSALSRDYTVDSNF